MSSAKDSFKIKGVNREEERLTAEVFLDPDHAIFAGHFPGNPVMPGVLNIEIMQAVMRDAFPDHHISDVTSIKFLNPVRPFQGVDLRYEVTWKNGDEGAMKVQATGILDDGIFVKILFKLSAS